MREHLRVASEKGAQELGRAAARTIMLMLRRGLASPGDALRAARRDGAGALLQAHGAGGWRYIPARCFACCMPREDGHAVLQQPSCGALL